MQGAVSQDKIALPHEKPQHPVIFDGFFMEITEVTNDQFFKFVKTISYVTTVERIADWEEIKKQLLEGDMIFEKSPSMFNYNGLIIFCYEV